ncbi:MAG: hypothetical protein Q9192_006434 [Flavoplaca navasiana]
MDPERTETSQFARNSNTQLLRRLSTIVKGQTATFACGGSVDLNDPLVNGGTSGVTIRWDADTPSELHKVSFPFFQHTAGFEALLRKCEPATFGLENRDVLDEGYRKAGKLDNTAFSTNFHPHGCGIVDAVHQILMPQWGDKELHGVRAELYKLNHFGQTVDFDWASLNPNSIQWAAFYGDCEHEVLEVTSGHRVTLTYNLYYTSLGNLALPMSDPTKLPLYDTAAQMLREPNFMRSGGYLGFFCHHAYAHSTEAGRKLIPGAFKGVDLAIFSAFGGLGLEVDVRPILHKAAAWEYSDEVENVWGGLSAKDLMQGSVSEGNQTGDFVEGYFKAVDRRQRDVLRDHDDDDADCYEHGEDLRHFLSTCFLISEIAAYLLIM